VTELVTIKGSKDIIIFHFNTNAAGLEELSQALLAKLESNPGFFTGARYLIEPENGFSGDETAALEEIINNHGMERAVRVAQPKPHKEKPQLSGEKVYAPTVGDSELLYGSLRSGASVSVRGHAIVAGDVNAGAEISASGHIVVMGTCRGIVHAGCLGDRSAFVIAHRLQAIQIRIADLLCAPEEQTLTGKPQIAYCLGDEIAVSDYNSNYYKNLP